MAPGMTGRHLLYGGTMKYLLIEISGGFSCATTLLPKEHLFEFNTHGSRTTYGVPYTYGIEWAGNEMDYQQMRLVGVNRETLGCWWVTPQWRDLPMPILYAYQGLKKVYLDFALRAMLVSC